MRILPRPSAAVTSAPALARAAPVDSRTLLAWLFATLSACVGALLITTPALGLRLLGIACLIWGANCLIARPLLCAYVALWVFPWCTLVRTAILVFHPELPFFFASRFWLETLTLLAFFGVCTRAIVRREMLRLGMDDVPFLLLVLASAYSLFIAGIQHAYITAILGIYFSLTPVLLYFVVRWARPTGAHVRGLCKTLLATYTVLALLSLGDYFLHPTFMLRLYSGFRATYFQGDVDEIRNLVTTQYLRMQSLLMEENVWGQLCGCVSLLAIAGVTSVRVSAWSRWALGGVLSLSLACLVLSMSRGAAAGFVAGVVVLLLLRRGRRLQVLLVALLIGAAAMAGYLALRADGRVRQLEARFLAPQKGQPLDTGRAWQWRVSIETLTEFPSGLGLGGTGYAQHAAGTGRDIAMDGIYLRVLTEQGIPGAFLWAIGIAGVGVVLLKRYRLLACGLEDGNQVPKELALLEVVGIWLSAELVSLCIHGLTANTFDYYYVPPVFFLFTALYIACTDRIVLSRRPYLLGSRSG